MSVGLADPLLTAFVEQGANISTEASPYLWSDLVARRTALGLSANDLSALLRIEPGKYRSREIGAREVGPHLVGELIKMEAFVACEAATLVAAAPVAGAVVLQAATEHAAFIEGRPDAVTTLHRDPFPLVLQHVAVGRAAGALSRAGRDVEVHRGSRRFDLAARRLAVGLGKNQASALFRIGEKSYYNAERGAKPPQAGLIAELQAIDDFIASTATQLEWVDSDSVCEIVMIDDQDLFEREYPRARTRRDGVPYPCLVHAVCAARLAGELEAAGMSVRVVVDVKGYRGDTDHRADHGS